MENVAVKIRSITLKSYKCFEDVDISCVREDDTICQWTILLGNNNTGKTSLLKAIANLRPVLFKRITGNKVALSQDIQNKEYIPAIIYDKESLAELRDNSLVGCSIVAEKTIPWSYDKVKATVTRNSDMERFYIYGYGVSRYPSKTSLSESLCDNCASLFSSDQRLINIEEWLMQLDYAAKNDKPMADSRLYRIKELLCGNLFPEILDFKFESSDALHNYTLFQTKDGWFRYTQLGYGYQSMLSWIVDLCKRMFERYPESENPLQESAVVLVDEIDLHLHPKWQRDIIPFLSGVFPNIQFIVTTHSPLVIQSMSDVNLYVLHREGDKVLAERSSVSNFKGWTVEEILRDTMRLESDIHSDEYQEYIKLFDQGLDQHDKEKVCAAYNVLCRILHPGSSLRRLLELQLSQMSDNDKTESDR